MLLTISSLCFLQKLLIMSWFYIMLEQVLHLKINSQKYLDFFITDSSQSQIVMTQKHFFLHYFGKSKDSIYGYVNYRFSNRSRKSEEGNVKVKQGFYYKTKSTSRKLTMRISNQQKRVLNYFIFFYHGNIVKLLLFPPLFFPLNYSPYWLFLASAC